MHRNRPANQQQQDPADRIRYDPRFGVAKQTWGIVLSNLNRTNKNGRDVALLWARRNLIECDDGQGNVCVSAV